MALIARRSAALLQGALLVAMLGTPAVARAADPAPTITSITSSINPSVRPQPVTFTATVTLGDGTTPVTVGTVKFGRGSSCGAGFTGLQAARAVDANGQVTYTTVDIFFGTTTIWACYEGVAGETLNSGASVIQVVVSAPVPTTLAVAPASGFFGGTANLSATLTVTSGGGPVAGVTVGFTLNGTAVGGATTDASGVATMSAVSLAGIATGTYPAGIGATFAGNANRASSSGSAALTVGPAAEETSVTTVTCAPGPFVYTGEPVTPCSVTVTGSNGLSLTPDPVYADNVDAGTATASYDYPGDATHGPSSDSETFEIGQATLHVDAAPGSKTYGDAEPALAWTYSGFVANEDATSAGITGSADCARAPGETVLGSPYAISCSPGTLSAANYGFETGATASFAIDPADADCAVAGFDGPFDGLPHGATGSCTGVPGEDVSGGLDLGGAFTDVPGGLASWTFVDPNYGPQSGGVAIVITPAPVSVSVSCPAFVAYTGLPQTPCTASVTGAGGLDEALDVAYDNNVTGIATASATYPGDANHAPGSASTTFVIGYDWTGFLQPINDTAHQAGLDESRFRLGQTIPLKFMLLDALGNPIAQDTNPTFSRSGNRGTCDATAVSDTVPDVEPTGGTEFTWDGGQYHFNWSTRGLTPGEYRIFANLADGTHRSVDVCLTR